MTYYEIRGGGRGVMDTKILMLKGGAHNIVAGAVRIFR